MKNTFTTIYHKKSYLYTEQTNHSRFCSESFEVEWIENGKLKTKFFNTKKEVQKFLKQQ
jgi:hypothetical protein